MIKKSLSLLTALALFLGVGASVFADTATVGTLVINQNGANGTVGVVGGGSTGTVGANVYTETTATPGSYTITVTAPAGFVLNSVKDGANVVLASPYTQVLAAGATITFNVTYVAASSTTTPSATTEITRQMITDKTKLCSAMKGGADKRLCMKERNKMMRDFQKQEKAKREAARKLDTDKDGVPDYKDAFPQDPKEWKDSDKDGVGDNAEKLAKDTAKAAIKVKIAECAKLAAGSDKDKCLADLNVLRKAYNDANKQNSFGKKVESKDNNGNHNGKK